MAQFDVHRNLGRNREHIPYVVVVQSSWFDDYRRRVVVPLVRKSSLGKIASERFNPEFKIERTLVVLHPLEIVSVAVEHLGECVTSLGAEGELIVDALDVLFARAWK